MSLCSNINLPYLYVYIYISKRSSSIDQIFINIKHKVKRMARFIKTTTRAPIHILSPIQLSTWED